MLSTWERLGEVDELLEQADSYISEESNASPAEEHSRP